LIAEGVAVADPLGLGLRTDDFGALVDTGGQTARNLFYIGPMLRPRYWETTAVQELRAHAERLAWHLARPAEKTTGLARVGLLSRSVPGLTGRTAQ
jgi:uncharacterized NAD(P)/FAD-binding protein YdhS